MSQRNLAFFLRSNATQCSDSDFFSLPVQSFTPTLPFPFQDEIEIDIGDPVYVQKEAEDLWCEGANLRTGLIGIFPIAHVVDVDYSDFDPNDINGSSRISRGNGGLASAAGAATDVRKERYLLEYIG